MLTLTLDKPGAAPARNLQLSLNKGAAFKVTVAWQCDARHQYDIDIHALEYLHAGNGGQVEAPDNILSTYNQEASDHNILNVATTGSGTGDLAVSLTSIDPNAVEGYLLLSATPPAIVGTGPLLGLNPDGLTWSIFNVPAFPGNPLHFPLGYVGYFPDVPFTVGAGGGAIFAGQTWDFVAVLLGTGVTYVGRSGVKRITW